MSVEMVQELPPEPASIRPSSKPEEFPGMRGLELDRLRKVLLLMNQLNSAAEVRGRVEQGRTEASSAKPLARRLSSGLRRRVLR